MGSAERLTGAPVPAAAGWAVLLISTLARALLAAGVSVMLWALLPAAFGMVSTTVMSGSMEPAIRVGDVVVAHPIDPAEARPGRVVLVDDPDHAGRMRLHRVVAVEDDGRLVLRGDANAAADSSTVAPSAVHGAGFLRVPLAGLPMVWARTGDWLPLTLLVVGSAGLLLLARTDRVLLDAPDRRPRPTGRGRRSAAAGGGLALALVLTVAGASPSPAWAGFLARTSRPASTFATAAFPCLTASRTPAVATPTVEYRFAETSGTTTSNVAGGGADGQLLGSVTRAAGSCARNDGPSVVLGASGAGSILVPTSMTAPGAVTVAVWFRTSTAGGVLAGFGSSGTAAPSTTFDRQLTMNADGSLTFRVLTALGASAFISAPALRTGGYADGEWHQAVVTLAGLGAMSIAVDGAVAASSVLSLSLSFYTGYLRFGNDAVPGSTTSPFRGSMSTVQVWVGTVLTTADIAALSAGGR